MTRKTIPAKSAAAEWRKDPAFVREYESLEDEFALAAQLIEARARAGLTQAELAARMGTSQSAVARLMRDLGFRPGQFPHAERYAERALTIPLFPKLTHQEQDAFVEALLETA